MKHLKSKKLFEATSPESKYASDQKLRDEITSDVELMRYDIEDILVDITDIGFNVIVSAPPVVEMNCREFYVQLDHVSSVEFGGVRQSIPNPPYIEDKHGVSSVHNGFSIKEMMEHLSSYVSKHGYSVSIFCGDAMGIHSGGWRSLGLILLEGMSWYNRVDIMLVKKHTTGVNESFDKSKADNEMIEDIKDICLELEDKGYITEITNGEVTGSLTISRDIGDLWQSPMDRFNISDVQEVLDRLKDYLGDKIYITWARQRNSWINLDSKISRNKFSGIVNTVKVNFYF